MMQLRNLLVLAAALFATSLIAADKQIDDIEARFEKALTARDRKALEPLLAENFMWIHSSDGRVDTRDVFLANSAQGMALSGQRNARTEHGSTLSVTGDTAIRVSRVRLLDAALSREAWMRQTHVFVRHRGAWKLALGQGTVMYEGAVLDTSIYPRYEGTYAIEGGRKLTLASEDGALFATFPNGAKTQIFLASPTEETNRMLGVGRLRFTLGADGRPTAASLMRNDKEVWRAKKIEEK